MKISNYKLTHCIAFILSIAILLCLSGILFLDKIVFDLCLVGLGVILCIILFRLECVVYENSGNCVTFRKYHPFTSKKFIPPFIELPQSNIKDYKFQQGIGMSKLILNVDSTRRKNFVVKMILFGFSSSQSKQINTSLQTIRLKNNNTQFFN